MQGVHVCAHSQLCVGLLHPKSCSVQLASLRAVREVKWRQRKLALWFSVCSQCEEFLEQCRGSWSQACIFSQTRIGLS